MTAVGSSLPPDHGPSAANPLLAASGKDAAFRIPAFSVQQILRGVLQATKTSEGSASAILQWMETCFSNPTSGLGILLPPKQWKEKMTSELVGEAGQLRHLATTALAMSILRERSRQNDGEAIEAEELAFVWDLIYDAITADVRPPLFFAARSAQGFLSVPLCSLTKDGSIDELYRLHVWMPDGKGGNRDFAVHSHQTFIRSWILAGEGKDQRYEVDLDPDPATATHAQYSLSWNDGTQTGTAYTSHQQFSVVTNTHKPARAVPLSADTHTRGMTYSVPAGTYHRTTVQPDDIHATIAVFDSQGGYIKDAPVLGPIDAESFTQHRDPAGTTATELAQVVQSLRSWEDLVRQSEAYAGQAQWEHALQSLNSALHMCDVVPVFQNAKIYRHLARGELGSINRRLGRYDIAIDILETTLGEMAASERSLELSGELGVIYRHMARLDDGKRVLELQYATAKELGFERTLCRVVGNLEMVNYQLYLNSGDKELLEEAFQQQLERIESSRRLSIPTWESIGLARILLCHAARGDTELAVETSLASLEMSRRSKDPTRRGRGLGHAVLPAAAGELGRDVVGPAEAGTRLRHGPRGTLRVGDAGPGADAVVGRAGRRTPLRQAVARPRAVLAPRGLSVPDRLRGRRPGGGDEGGRTGLLHDAAGEHARPARRVHRGARRPGQNRRARGGHRVGRGRGGRCREPAADRDGRLSRPRRPRAGEGGAARRRHVGEAHGEGIHRRRREVGCRAGQRGAHHDCTFLDVPRRVRADGTRYRYPFGTDPAVEATHQHE